MCQRWTVTSVSVLPSLLCMHDVYILQKFVFCTSLTLHYAPQMPLNRNWCIKEDSWIWFAARELLVNGWYESEPV